MTVTYADLFGDGPARYGDFNGPLYGSGRPAAHDVVFTAGAAQASWDTSTTTTRWQAGDPTGRFATEPVETQWEAGDIG